MPEHSENVSAADDSQREAATPQPSQEPSAFEDPPLPSFTGLESMTPPAESEGAAVPGVPAPTAEAPAPALAAGAVGGAEAAPEKQEPAVEPERPAVELVSPPVDIEGLTKELSDLRGSLEEMQKAAADRVSRHRAQILNDLGIRKETYMQLAPSADPATAEGKKTLTDWALENPGLFAPAPNLPEEKEAREIGGMFNKTRQTWRDVFGG